MKSALSLALLLLFSVFSPEVRAVNLDPQLKELEASLEARIQDEIHTFFGKNAKMSVTVHAVTKKPAGDAAGAGTGGANDPSAALDLSYLPVPASEDYLFGGSVAVESVEVELKALPSVPDNTVAAAQEMIEKSLKAYNPKVNVTRIGAGRDIASDDGPGFWDSLSDEMKKAILTMIAILLGGGLVVGGISLLGKALSKGAESIAGGLAAINANAGTKVSGELGINAVGFAGGQADKVTETTKDREQLPTYKYNSRNISIAKDMLRTDPITFRKALGDTDSELRGIKWFLPCLEKGEQDQIKEYLGEDRVTRMGQLDDADMDYSVWLQSFVERLLVKKIEGGSEVEKALSQEQSLKFIAAPAKHIVTAAKSVNTPAAWRIATEYLSRQELEKTFKTLDNSQMQALASSADATPDDIKSTADQMIQVIENPPDSGEEDPKKAMFYSGKLLGPLVKSLEGKDFKEVEEMIESLGQSAPDLVKLLQKTIWTPKQMDDVPNDYLSKLVKKMDNEQRFALVYALPETQGKRIEGMLPEGMVKTIVMDRIKKAQQKQDPAVQLGALQVCREFLDYLRRQHEAGEFKLASEDGGSAGGATQDQPTQTATGAQGAA